MTTPRKMDLRSATALPKVPTPKLTPRERTFAVRYTDREGQQYAGTFISRVPDAETRREINRACGLQAGAPWAHLPDALRQELVAANTVARQILEPRPAWFDRWALEDTDLLYSVYGVCVEHAAAFFRGDGGSGEGSSEQTRVAITVEDADAAGAG